VSRRALRHCLLGAVVTALLALGAAPAAAAGTGTITGVVRDDTGAPAQGVCVQSTPASPQPWPAGAVQTGHADAAGAYAVAVPAGSYNLYIYDCNANGAPRWAGVYRGGGDLAEDSPPVAVTDGGTSTVDLMAPRPATVSGRVTYDDGTPVPHTCVHVYGHREAQLAPYATTRDDGTFEVFGVAPGARRILFGNCEGSSASYGQWYRGADSYDTATVVDVAAGSVSSGVDGTLRRYAAVGGRIVDETGAPVVGACAQLQSSSGGGFTGFSGCTDKDGRWRIERVRPSAYFVYAGPGSAGPNDDLVARYYPAASSAVGATPVVVVEGIEIPGLDMVLPHGARMSGRITDPNGQPLVGACAYASPVGAGYNAPTALTDADGRYVIRGVDVGVYQVQFLRCRAGNWAPRWQGATPGGPAPAGLQVQLGQDITGLDGTMQPGGIVTGRVLDTGGKPIAGICATAAAGTRQEDAQTDATGVYTLLGLPTSTDHYVVWRDCTSARYATQYSGGGKFLETAQHLSLTAGQTTTLPDTILAVAGSISGTVTDARTGLRVGEVCAYALDPGQQLLGGYGSTDGDGHYRIKGLTPGQWVVRFVDCGANLAVPEYWDDTLLFNLATRITVPEEGDRSGVDAAVLLLTVPSAPRLPLAVPDASSAILSWQPPADDGSAAILSYQVLNDAGIVVKTTTGEQTSTRVDNLTPGRSYAFAVRATNRKGTGPASSAITVTPGATSPAPASGPPVAVPAMEFSGPTLVVAGNAASLRVTARDAAGPRVGVPVFLEGRAAGSTVWNGLASAVTDSAGHATFTRRPTRTSVYRVVDRATGVRSAAVVVTTSLRIGVRAGASTAPLGRRVPLAVSVSPAQPGRRVILQVFGGSGWRDVSGVTLTRLSQATVWLQPTMRGTRSYRIRLSSSIAYAASVSPAVVLRTV
jgi:protocatechuate 3,4-dioxygenase beta subunit